MASKCLPASPASNKGDISAKDCTLLPVCGKMSDKTCFLPSFIPKLSLIINLLSTLLTRCSGYIFWLYRHGITWQLLQNLRVLAMQPFSDSSHSFWHRNRRFSAVSFCFGCVRLCIFLPTASLWTLTLSYCDWARERERGRRWLRLKSLACLHFPESFSKFISHFTNSASAF